MYSQKNNTPRVMIATLIRPVNKVFIDSNLLVQKISAVRVHTMDCIQHGEPEVYLHYHCKHAQREDEVVGLIVQ